MDPITCAARRFLVEMDEHWEAGDRRVVRMIVEDADRGELAKALRLGEALPENRRPLLLAQAPFVEPRGYFNGLAEQIAQDYERIRRGAAEEGVALAPFPTEARGTSRPLEPIQRAALAIECVTTLLDERLDGALVALVPAHIEALPQWQKSIAMLSRASLSPNARLAISDKPDGPLTSVLGPRGARFVIDRAKLLAYTRKLVTGSTMGPAMSSPSASKKTNELGMLLLDAAERMREDDPSGAASQYERAIVLCQVGKLALEEACLHIALAGACLAAGNAPRALGIYQKAVELGEQSGAPQIACQGRLGMAGVAFALKRYGAASAAYEAAADAAERASLPPLMAEATRMVGICGRLQKPAYSRRERFGAL